MIGSTVVQKNHHSQYSSQLSSITSSQADNITAAKDRLIQSISNDPNLPAIGSSISRIVRLSSSDDESIQKLAYYVLSDVSLTQKILRLANSIHYCSETDKKVTNISKAIFLLGFNTVKTSALALLLVDRMPEKFAQSVRTELIHALISSMVGRELAKNNLFRDAEELAVVTLFKNIGRLLVASYDQNLYQEMTRLIEQGSHTLAQASIQVLGCSLEDFTETILKKWNIPISIIQAIKAPPRGILKAPKNRLEWMRQAAEFSENAVPLVLQNHDSSGNTLETELLSRFGRTLGLNQTKLTQLITHATQETQVLTKNTKLTFTNTKPVSGAKVSNTTLDADLKEDLLTELLLVREKDDDNNLMITQCHPSGKPFNAYELLLAGVHDLTEFMSSGNYKINELIMLSLETLYNSLGFRFATFCLKDVQSNQYRARNSLGLNNSDYRQSFVFPATPSTNIFHLAMKKNVDLLISDTSSQKVQALLPQWHCQLLPDTRSFIVLPLEVKKKPIGLFYADRERTAPEGISSKEMMLIKTLKGQILTALNSK